MKDPTRRIIIAAYLRMIIWFIFLIIAGIILHDHMRLP